MNEAVCNTFGDRSFSPDKEHLTHRMSFLKMLPRDNGGASVQFRSVLFAVLSFVMLPASTAMDETVFPGRPTTPGEHSFVRSDDDSERGENKGAQGSFILRNRFLVKPRPENSFRKEAASAQNMHLLQDFHSHPGSIRGRFLLPPQDVIQSDLEKSFPATSGQRFSPDAAQGSGNQGNFLPDVRGAVGQTFPPLIDTAFVGDERHFIPGHDANAPLGFSEVRKPIDKEAERDVSTTAEGNSDTDDRGFGVERDQNSRQFEPPPSPNLVRLPQALTGGFSGSVGFPVFRGEGFRSDTVRDQIPNIPRINPLIPDFLQRVNPRATQHEKNFLSHTIHPLFHLQPVPNDHMTPPRAYLNGEIPGRKNSFDDSRRPTLLAEDHQIPHLPLIDRRIPQSLVDKERQRVFVGQRQFLEQNRNHLNQNVELKFPATINNHPEDINIGPLRPPQSPNERFVPNETESPLPPNSQETYNGEEIVRGGVFGEDRGRRPSGSTEVPSPPKSELSNPFRNQSADGTLLGSSTEFPRVTLPIRTAPPYAINSFQISPAFPQNAQQRFVSGREFSQLLQLPGAAISNLQTLPRQPQDAGRSFNQGVSPGTVFGFPLAGSPNVSPDEGRFESTKNFQRPIGIAPSRGAMVAPESSSEDVGARKQMLPAAGPLQSPSETQGSNGVQFSLNDDETKSSRSENFTLMKDSVKSGEYEQNSVNLKSMLKESNTEEIEAEDSMKSDAVSKDSSEVVEEVNDTANSVTLDSDTLNDSSSAENLVLEGDGMKREEVMLKKSTNSRALKQEEQIMNNGSKQLLGSIENKDPVYLSQTEANVRQIASPRSAREVMANSQQSQIDSLKNYSSKLHYKTGLASLFVCLLLTCNGLLYF